MAKEPSVTIDMAEQELILRKNFLEFLRLGSSNVWL